MASFAIIHGGGDSASSWDLVQDALRARGHHPIAVDLPTDRPGVTWASCADTVAAAARGHAPVIVVAHSLGGFVAPLVCDRVLVSQLVLVAAMIPQPNSAAEGYWGRAGYPAADFTEDSFYHDLTQDAIARAKRAERAQEESLMSEPHPMREWPKVRTRYLLCRDDRVFPADVTRVWVRSQLHITPDEIPGGHCIYLARPAELAERLHQYASS
ncbi:MAG: alpha/beta hydrolase [Polyangiales bacterium]